MTDSLNLDLDRVESPDCCELCGRRHDEKIQDMEHLSGVSDFVRRLSSLEEKDFIGARIVMLLIRHPGISYQEMSDHLTRRFGEDRGISRKVVRHKIDKLVGDFPGLESFLGLKRKSVLKKKRRKRKISYSNGGDDE